MQKQIPIASLVLTLVLMGSGCVFPGVYRFDVQQGNIVEASSLNKLNTGMTRRQVHFVLGNPVINPIFDDAMETYTYTIQLEGGKIHQQTINLHYQEDVLAEIEKVALLPENLANPGKAYKSREKDEFFLDRWLGGEDSEI